MLRGAPVLVFSQNTERECGYKVQRDNINVVKAIADLIRTSLGPRAMLKMLVDTMGGLVLTNDGNAILREISVKHATAKSIIEISRTLDEETGDGTTSVIVLAGEIMSQASPFIEQNIHPTVVIKAYRLALEDMVKLAEEKFSVPLDVNDDQTMHKVLKSCLGSKMLAKYMDLATHMALTAVRMIKRDVSDTVEIDIKRYCRFEKIPGGRIEDSCVLRGVILNKDVTHAKMRRRIEKPRVVLLDCNLEYKKGESQMSIDVMNEKVFTVALEQEELSIRQMCDDIIRVKPDVVFTEKGISDLAQHFLVKAGISGIRRVKKTDNNRLARVTGATILHDTSDLKEEYVGTLADLFEISKIGDEYYTYVTSENTTSVTLMIRGPSKDIANEVERNLQDAVNVARNVIINPRLVPGGGALEMALAEALNEKCKSIKGVLQWPYKAAARALEVIPRTLVQNCGGAVIRQLTALRAKHAQIPDNWTWGINGETGELVDMNVLGVWDPLAVRLQVLKTAIETSAMILRVDDILSGVKKLDGTEGGAPQ